MGDPGCVFSLGSRVAVFLDGELQKNLAGWDVDAGTVTKYVFDDDGSLIVEADENGEVRRDENMQPFPITEELTGVVEAKWIGDV